MGTIAIFEITARVLMAMVFVWSGSDKLRHPQPLSVLLNAHGYSISPLIVRLCGACEIVAAGLLAAGMVVPAVCLALATFVLVANLMVNNFWAKTGMDAAQTRQRAIPSAGMVAGLLYMAGVAYFTA